MIPSIISLTMPRNRKCKHYRKTAAADRLIPIENGFKVDDNKAYEAYRGVPRVMNVVEGLHRMVARNYCTLQ